MKSQELARAAGVTVRTVRYYHQIGVLPEPDRATNGYRTYGVRHLARLLRIRQLTLLGVPLEDVRPILERDPAVSTDEMAKKLVTDLDARISLLIHQRDSLTRRRTEGHPLEGPAGFAGTLESVHVAFGLAPDAIQTDMDFAAIVDHTADEALREGLQQALIATSRPQTAQKLIPLITRLSNLTDDATQETRTALAYDLWSALADLAVFIPHIDASHPLTPLVRQLRDETLNHAQRNVLEIIELLQAQAAATTQE